MSGADYAIFQRSYDTRMSKRTQTMKILVVDDDAGLLQGLEIGLKGGGHEVTTARSGEQAMELMNAGTVSIQMMIADFQMGGMDGLQLIRSVREILPDIHAILMTGSADNRIQKEVKKLRLCDYLEKPFTRDMLIRKIDGIASETSY